ncbi:MAG: ABC transporter substrate-binding protein, partial [Dehalococcoidia bacterium]
EGSLNVGLKEMGPFFVHPSVMTNPQIFVQGTAPIGEGLLQQDINRVVKGLLAESWTISDDFKTWTFNLTRGVQFHKGYGEMTAEDVVYSMQENRHSKHPRAGQLEKFWEDRPGSSTPDEYTVVVNTGDPVVELIAVGWHMTPGGAATYIVSKKQSEEIGVEAAKEDIAATGPWEIVEHKTAEFWRMEAVEDHWRQTPHFAELVYWEIPEESSRIAGFQTGKLDTFLMSFDTIPLVEEVEGGKVMSVPNAVLMRNRLYGNWYPIPGVETRPGYDPELPWVSPTDNVNSPDWDRARKVRKGLFMAIDRDALVETILGGRGHTRTPLSGYTDFMHLLEGHEYPAYDPDGAKALFAEAGYPDGFSITLTPSIRGAAAEVESCEVIAQMWNDVGLDVNFQRIPYGTLRPTLVGRTYQGMTCHAGSPSRVPAQGYGSYLSENPFNRGLEHIYTEERMLAAQAAVDPAERERLETEIAAFLLDNYLTDLVYYTMDAVWPVGPRLEPWTEHVRTSDVRQINGYEYIKHRK